MGRCKYEEKVKPYLEQIGDWYQMWSEEHIAKQLGVSYTAWKGYKKKYPELMQVLVDAQKKLVNELKKSLKMKAKGYEYEEYKITVKEVGGEEVSRGLILTRSRYTCSSKTSIPNGIMTIRQR